MRAYAVLALLILAGCAGPSTQLPGVSTDEVALEKRQQEIFRIQSIDAQNARVANVWFKIASPGEC